MITSVERAAADQSPTRGGSYKKGGGRCCNGDTLLQTNAAILAHDLKRHAKLDLGHQQRRHWHGEYKVTHDCISSACWA